MTAYSVIIPLFNEAENLKELYQRLKAVMEALNGSYEMLFIDDGSTDGSFALLKAVHAEDERVKVIRFARNFGQHMALTAGLRKAQGDVVITMDADLQNPPEEIPILLSKLEEGYELVFGARQDRRGSLVRRLGSKLVAFGVAKLTNIQSLDSVSSFVAMRKGLVEMVNQCSERSKFLVALYAWLSAGRCASVKTRYEPRRRGESKYSLWKLAVLTFNLLANFSTFPLQLSSILGFITAFLGLVFALLLLFFPQLLSGMNRGFAWLFSAILLLSGVQLISLGMIGEYLARIYHEVRGRPEYIIREVLE